MVDLAARTDIGHVYDASGPVYLEDYTLAADASSAFPADTGQWLGMRPIGIW